VMYDYNHRTSYSVSSNEHERWKNSRGVRTRTAPTAALKIVTKPSLEYQKWFRGEERGAQSGRYGVVGVQKTTCFVVEHLPVFSLGIAPSTKPPRVLDSTIAWALPRM
jgi:hypothetical protein